MAVNCRKTHLNRMGIGAFRADLPTQFSATLEGVGWVSSDGASGAQSELIRGDLGRRAPGYR